jgi:hypothetical protein
MQGQTLYLPGGSSGIGTSTNNRVGINVASPDAQVDVRSSAHVGALYLQGRNANVIGGGTASTPYALKVDFNEVLFPPSGLKTNTYLTMHGHLFLGDFTNEIATNNLSDFHLNTKQQGIAVHGTGTNRLVLKYDGVHGNMITWQSNNTDPIKKNLIFSYDQGAPLASITPEGKFAIGTTNTPGTHKLYIGGSAIAAEVVVKLQTNWPDYVFEPTYTMLNNAQLRQYIATNGKLPYLPAAAAVAENGLPLGETQAQLTRLVEELTLRLLEMDGRVADLEAQLEAAKQH